LLLLLLLPFIWLVGLWGFLQDVLALSRNRGSETLGGVFASYGRNFLSTGLRTALVVFLTLALAEPLVRQSNENMTVLFVLDRSASVPAEYQEEKDAQGQAVDLRARRLLAFINQSVEKRGVGHERDRAG